jgi:hypothetical protein
VVDGDVEADVFEPMMFAAQRFQVALARHTTRPGSAAWTAWTA